MRREKVVYKLAMLPKSKEQVTEKTFAKCFVYLSKEYTYTLVRNSGQNGAGFVSG